MAFSLKNILVITLSMLALVFCNANAQLVNNFYSTSCPSVGTIVRNAMREAINQEIRMAASILRLFFHDCFVNGCDGSILLDDTATLTGEKNAFPNQNSVRGYEVIDTIKTRVEAACTATVSCADILALAARDAVFLTGGADWVVPVGRRDARTASQTAANNDLPPPTADLPALLSSFEAKGLRLRDLVILSGAHTMGSAQCSSFRTRIYNETNIDPAFASARRAGCPSTGSDTNLAVFDGITPNRFDNSYYINLQNRRGLLHSDQALLFQNGSTAGALIRFYSNNAADFQEGFAAAMVKLGNISPLTGTNGEIRRNCRVPN